MKLATISTPKELAAGASWDSVKYWATMAGKFQHASVAAQVMCGFALLELKKANNIKPGNPHAGLITAHAVIKTWDELVAENAGISDDTAGRWMKMADGIKAKWKKLAPQEKLKELMSVSPSQWTETDTKLVNDSLHKATDGQTQTDFMRELGLAKKKSGNPNAGNHEHGPKKKLSTQEAAAEMRRFAVEDSAAMGMAIQKSNTSFGLTTEVNDLEVEAQCALLEFGLLIRRKWLATPKAKRDWATIEAMVKAEATK